MAQACRFIRHGFYNLSFDVTMFIYGIIIVKSSVKSKNDIIVWLLLVKVVKVAHLLANEHINEEQVNVLAATVNTTIQEFMYLPKNVLSNTSYKVEPIYLYLSYHTLTLFNFKIRCKIYI